VAERRDAVKSVEGDAQIARESVHDALLEQLVIVGGITAGLLDPSTF
jgi:hypothetical protein